MQLGGGHAHAENHEYDQPLEDVVAERALELRDDERPESAQRGGGIWRPASGIWCCFPHHDHKANRLRGEL